MAVFLLVALIGADAPHASASPSSLDAVRDLVTLKRSDLLTLPQSTKVKTPTGRIVSLADLYKEHVARMARFASAAASGRSMLARLRTPPVPLVLHSQIMPVHPGPVSLPSPPQKMPVHPGPVSISSPSSSPTPLISVGAMGLINQMQQSKLLPVATSNTAVTFAKDYDDYCSQAQASVCLYFPPAGNGTGNFFEVPVGNEAAFREGSGYLDDYDYFVDQQQCQAGYGSWGSYVEGSPELCSYHYPLESVVRWTETTPPSATITGTCVDPNGNALGPFESTYDHYGAYNLAFAVGIPAFNDLSSCVIQIRAVPT